MVFTMRVSVGTVATPVALSVIVAVVLVSSRFVQFMVGRNRLKGLVSTEGCERSGDTNDE